jgi:hypothetical protein
MSDSKKHFRELFEELKARGLTDYGSIIDGAMVRNFLGIEYPEVGTKAQFDKIALAELGAIDYARAILLNEGKYITSTPSGYRILLPSENARQVDAYIMAADRKLSRALKLNRNTPVDTSKNASQTEARILMRRQSRQF